MSDIQDQINQILNNPEAMQQVRSLGAKLGLDASPSAPSAPSSPQQQSGDSGDLTRALGTLAPLMKRASAGDETAALLNALRPFLSEERALRLDQAQRLMKLMKLIPLIKDSGLFL
ncbi:MAG: hypothetical protein UIH27_19145 [Ruminococcus sp.]|nr:hypothetical protein [Ruminococcus sp.]